MKSTGEKYAIELVRDYINRLLQGGLPEYNQSEYSPEDMHVAVYHLGKIREQLDK